MPQIPLAYYSDDAVELVARQSGILGRIERLLNKEDKGDLPPDIRRNKVLAEKILKKNAIIKKVAQLIKEAIESEAGPATATTTMATKAVAKTNKAGVLAGPLALLGAGGLGGYVLGKEKERQTREFYTMPRNY